MLKIEGTVEFDGKVYEAFDYRRARDEHFWADDDNVYWGSTLSKHIILREVKPPHEYKVGDYVKVVRASDNPDCNGVHPVGSVRRVNRVCGEKLDVAGDYFLFIDNVEPCDPPAPKYRPFANAAEFKPHRDRWIQRSSKHDTPETIPSGCFRVTAYNDHHVWTSDGKTTSYESLLEEGKKFDGGSPCGVLVDE